MQTDVPTDSQPEGRAFTMEAMRPVRGGGRFRRLPRLTLTALRLVRVAAPRPLVATVTLQVLAAVALGAQLVLGRHALSQLIAIERTTEALHRSFPNSRC